MMFLVRSAFWLVVLILLIPTDEAQQKKMYGTAQAAVEDIRSFCDRNPDTCATGQNLFNVLVQKAQYGAQMVQTLVNEHATGASSSQPPANILASDTAGMPAPSAVMPVPQAEMPAPSAVPIEPTPWIQTEQQNTLKPADLQAEWSGPNV